MHTQKEFASFETMEAATAPHQLLLLTPAEAARCEQGRRVLEAICTMLDALLGGEGATLKLCRVRECRSKKKRYAAALHAIPSKGMNDWRHKQCIKDALGLLRWDDSEVCIEKVVQGIFHKLLRRFAYLKLHEGRMMLLPSDEADEGLTAAATCISCGFQSDTHHSTSLLEYTSSFDKMSYQIFVGTLKYAFQFSVTPQDVETANVVVRAALMDAIALPAARRHMLFFRRAWDNRKLPVVDGAARLLNDNIGSIICGFLAEMLVCGADCKSEFVGRGDKILLATVADILL